MSNLSVITDYVLTQDHQKIYFDHYLNGQRKLIILAHGFFNSRKAVLFKDMARDLGQDYDVLVFDFRGHGESSGLFTWTAKEDQDLMAILEYARPKYQKIGVVGFSLGSAVSIITAAKTDLISSLIVVSPPTQFDKIDIHFLGMDFEENVIYNLFREGRIGKGVRPHHVWFKKTRPMDAIAQIKIPIFFIHGEKDWLIRSWHSQKLYLKTGGQRKLEVMEGGTHAEYIYRRFPKKTMTLFKEWFHKTL